MEGAYYEDQIYNKYKKAREKYIAGIIDYPEYIKGVSSKPLIKDSEKEKIVQEDSKKREKHLRERDILKLLEEYGVTSPYDVEIALKYYKFWKEVEINSLQRWETMKKNAEEMEKRYFGDGENGG